MITKLTIEQESKIPEYFEKWSKIGLTYKKIDKDYAKKILLKYLSIIDLKPKYFLFLDSPMACQLAINLLKNIDNQLRNQLYNQLHNQLRNQLDNQLRNQLYNQLDNQLDNQLRNQLYNQLHNQLRNQLDNQLRNQLRNQLYNQKLEYYPIYYWTQSGNIISGYCAYYDYIESVLISLDKKSKKIWKNFKQVQSELHYFFVFQDFVFCSEKPVELNFNKNNQLHAENKPSVLYADGYSMYNLNGIPMPKKIVMTKADKLDCKMLYEITNVEVRQEFIKKVGLNRVLKELDCNVIDKINADNLYRSKKIGSWIQQGDVILEPEFENEVKYSELKKSFRENLKNIEYELINLQIKDNEYRPYLKMTNASLLDEIHVEGVAKECKTVFDALCFRNQKNTLPCMLT
jgi:hypothetical protein